MDRDGPLRRPISPRADSSKSSPAQTCFVSAAGSFQPFQTVDVDLLPLISRPKDISSDISHASPKMAPAATMVLSPIVEEGRAPSATPPMSVRVQIRIADPLIRSSYRREYASSHGFPASDRVCRALMRRIEHCSEELVTRKDSSALVHREPGQPPKPLRYEMAFTVFRRRGGIWGERTFRSYQRQPLTEDFANEIILFSHRVVGLFLRQHDKGFRWTDEPARDRCYGSLTTVRPSLGDPLPLTCVPASRFLESSQSFQFTPGYSIELDLRSQSRFRKQCEWTRTLRVKSTQSAPLNLAQGEHLLWNSYEAINGILRRKKEDFDAEHGSCDWLEGPLDCQHFEDKALDLELRVTNHLGPAYDHLSRSIRTKLALFREPDGEDCYLFLRDAQQLLNDTRDKADDQVSRMNDFELRIIELRGPGWRVERPAKFSLDDSVSYSQRSIEAILDRVQTGISDVLRGNDLAIHISAYKRGHLILDKAIVANSDRGSRPSTAASVRRTEPEAEKTVFVDRLKARIQQDLDRICKDTCSLDDIPPDDLTDDRLDPSTDDRADLQALLQHVEHMDSIDAFILDKPPTPTPESLVLGRAFPLMPAVNKKNTTTSTYIYANYSRPTTPNSRPQRVFPLVPAKYNINNNNDNNYSRVSSGSTLFAGDIFETPRTPPLAQLELSAHEPIRVRSGEFSPGPNYVISDEGITISKEQEQPAQHHKTPTGPEEEPPQPEPSELSECEAVETSAVYERLSQESSSMTSQTPVSTVDDDNAPTATTPAAAPESTCAVERSAVTPTQTKAFFEPITPDSEPTNKEEKNKELSSTEAGADVDIDVQEDSRRELYSTPLTRESLKPFTFYQHHEDLSSAPSTPGLSFGGDPSPRNSQLMTPTIVRTFSGVQHPLIKEELEEESDGEDSDRDLEQKVISKDPQDLSLHNVAPVEKDVQELPPVVEGGVVRNVQQDVTTPIHAANPPGEESSDEPLIAPMAEQRVAEPGENDADSSGPFVLNPNPEDDFSRTRSSFYFEEDLIPVPDVPSPTAPETTPPSQGPESLQESQSQEETTDVPGADGTGESPPLPETAIASALQEDLPLDLANADVAEGAFEPVNVVNVAAPPCGEEAVDEVEARTVEGEAVGEKEGVQDSDISSSASTPKVHAADGPEVVTAILEHRETDFGREFNFKSETSATCASDTGFEERPLSDSHPERESSRPRRALLPPAPIVTARNSFSSWEDCSSLSLTLSLSPSARDSVDTIQPAVDVTGADVATAPAEPAAVRPRPPSPARRKSMPTAGYLGLHQEARRVEFGLRGALVGSHCFDDDDDNKRRPASACAAVMLDRGGGDAAKKPPHTAPPPAGPSGPPLDPPPQPIHKRAGSATRAALLRPLRSSRRRAKSASVAERKRKGDGLPGCREEQPQQEQQRRRRRRGAETGDHPEADEHPATDKGMFPRVMMLFAGMAVASQVLNRK